MMASNDAISIVDVQQDGMPVTWVNPRFEELFGYRAEEIVGRSWGLLQEGIRQQYGLEIVSAALAGKTLSGRTPELHKRRRAALD